MMHTDEVTSHLIVTFVYFLVVGLVRWKFDLSYLLLWLGALLGTFFLDIDHLVYWFVTHPEKEDSKEAGEVIRGIRNVGEIKERFKGLYLLLLKYHHLHHQLIFHSVVGQAVLFVLAFYILSSGGSVFASAFILAINLHLLKDEWRAYLKNKEELSDWLFWQVRMPMEKYLDLYLVGASVLFLILTVFFI